MDYRFNSFYQDELHPFVKAMNNSLSASSDRLKIGPMIRKMMPWDKTAEKLQEDRLYMGKVAQDLVKTRRDNPTEKHDLLNAMIKNKDPKTGELMSDGLISANMITFLIAGHETTSGLLSFAMLYLLKNPATYFAARDEVDKVLGRGKMTVEHLKDLHYINAVLRETLRLSPTAPAFARSIRNDNPNDVEPLLGGKYAIRRDDKVLCLITKAQRDPKVYGEDANEFKPERMLEDNFQRLPKGAWKPFGNGVRACIGRAFAWQEAQMALALLLQSFNFTLDDPSYELKVKQTLTIKPDGFYMRATLRDGLTATSLQNLLTSSSEDVHSSVQEGIRRTDSALGTGKPLTIIYGSNTGTCQALAQKLSVEARKYGYSADVKEMNAAVDALPKGQPNVVITASYEGEPPDNADQFVAWLESGASSSLEGVDYAVFGCGHSDWKGTFHRIPNLVDQLLEKNGGKRLAPRGLTDAAKGDIYSDFDNWADHVFWPSFAPDSSGDQAMSTDLEVEMSTQNRSSYLRQDVQVAAVTDTRKLTADGQPEKRHLGIRLPSGMTYETGDYLAVLPLNPQENVSRAMKHFKISQDATITIKAGSATFLPTGVSISVADLLRGFVELSLPVTKKDLQACLEATKDPVEKAILDIFTEKEGFSEIVDQRVSLLDLCCKYPSIDLSFSTFISMLPPLRPRHYSISSSPLQDPTTCTITYGVIDEIAKSGIGRYIGVASTYLSALKPGDEILVSVRATNKFFHLPADLECPIMMIGGGSGIAPFRGFIQERATQITAGRKVGPALMFMGCRSETDDRLYADEVDAWVEMGALDVRYTFSKEPEKSNGCKYVQERLVKDKEDVLRMWREGAKFFICGSPALSTGVSEVSKLLLLESQQDRGQKMTEEQADEWFRARRNERFVVDVFA